jgi:NAD(P)-dependent dehydrogenase (short-subunit alcohol dehydrogenase family)
VNLSGAFYCCREAMKDMRRRAQPGAIILTASPHAFATSREIAAYAVTKGCPCRKPNTAGEWGRIG